MSINDGNIENLPHCNNPPSIDKENSSVPKYSSKNNNSSNKTHCIAGDNIVQNEVVGSEGLTDAQKQLNIRSVSKKEFTCN